MLIRLCLTTGVLIPTYSYYFLTQFGSFLFVRVKYYLELISGRTIFELLTMSNWKKTILCIWPSHKEEWARISNFWHSSSFGSRFVRVGLGHYTREQPCATEMKSIGKHICLNKLIHKLLFKHSGRRRIFWQNGIDITWNNDQKVKLVKQPMTGIRSFLQKWHNTVIPLTDYCVVLNVWL